MTPDPHPHQLACTTAVADRIRAPNGALPSVASCTQILTHTHTVYLSIIYEPFHTNECLLTRKSRPARTQQVIVLVITEQLHWPLTSSSFYPALVPRHSRCQHSELPFIETSVPEASSQIPPTQLYPGSSIPYGGLSCWQLRSSPSKSRQRYYTALSVKATSFTLPPVPHHTSPRLIRLRYCVALCAVLLQRLLRQPGVLLPPCGGSGRSGSRTNSDFTVAGNYRASNTGRTSPTFLAPTQRSNLGI